VEYAKFGETSQRMVIDISIFTETEYLQIDQTTHRVIGNLVILTKMKTSEISETEEEETISDNRVTREDER
jgi:hypothetical protein